MNRTPSATIFFVQITNYLKWKALHTFIQHISDLNPQNRKQHNTQFQSTLPQGERRHCGIGRCREFYFNPRSHKGSDLLQFVLLHLFQNFNPRSHKGSDDYYHPILANIGISIHAPTRGATTTNTDSESVTLFQSTLPQGERPNSRTWFRWFTYFNPRSHKGSDEINRMQVLHLRLFQSTLPQGERLSLLFPFHLVSYFNPRSHKGSDSNFPQF